MQAGGQSIVDRLLAAKNTIAGQSVAKLVCKATTEEMMGPKRKHLDCLLQATHEMSVSIPELADLLIERSQNSSWIVSFKSLITIHHLMSYGNERFEAYMASHNHHLQSTIDVDRNGMCGSDMTVYLRRYASYLYEKREAYKLLGYDLCKVKRGKDDALLRLMPVDKLFKVFPIVQKQIDALLQFEIAPNELINGVISSCFCLLVKDLVHLYVVFNHGIINLLEKYFDMNKKQCREGLDVYKKFIDRTDQVSQYLKIAERYEQLFDGPLWGETSGMERNEMWDITRAPNSLVEALENHLAHIEGKKISSQTTLARHQTEGEEVGMKSVTRDVGVNINVDPEMVLDEEAKAFARFNKKKEGLSPPPPSVSPRSATTTNGNGFGGTDFFTQHPSSSSLNGQQQQQQQQLFSGDLFSLTPSPSAVVTNPFSAFDAVPRPSVSQPNLFNDILQPTSTSTNTNKMTSTVPSYAHNHIAPTVVKPLQSGDLNSSLNQLIDNLHIEDHSRIGKDHQWTPNDGKGQQILGASSGTMNTAGLTWPTSVVTNTSFNGGGGVVTSVPSNVMWQQPPVVSSMTNPFAAPANASQMNFVGMDNQPMNVHTNPFAVQPSFYGNALFNQPQINNPFGSL